MSKPMGTSQNSEWQTLLLVVELLEEHNIQYMITGSLAKTYYSRPRMTRDIDVVLELVNEDVAKFIGAFQKDFYVDPPAVEDAVRQNIMFNVIHNVWQVKVDFIPRKHDEYRRVEFQRRKQIILQNQKAWIVSPEDLILSKLIWAKDSLSEMQLSDVRDLLRSVKGLDLAYIEEWVERLLLKLAYEKVER